jgi:hypothetical protein
MYPLSFAGACANRLKRFNQGNSMDRKIISSICDQVYQKYPEVRGSQPSVQDHGTNQQLLIFKGHATLADGKRIERVVRVVVNTDGHISKMTTSR